MEDSTPGDIGFTGNQREQLMYRLMLACATLACFGKKTEDAELVYAAVEPYVTDRQALTMYRGIALAMGGQAQVAVDMMQQRLAANPDDDMAKVALGVALLFMQDPEWRWPIDNVLATSLDQAARQAAVKTVTYVPAMLRRGGSVRATMRPA